MAKKRSAAHLAQYAFKKKGDTKKPAKKKGK